LSGVPNTASTSFVVMPFRTGPTLTPGTINMGVRFCNITVLICRAAGHGKRRRVSRQQCRDPHARGTRVKVEPSTAAPFAAVAMTVTAKPTSAAGTEFADTAPAMSVAVNVTPCWPKLLRGSRASWPRLRSCPAPHPLRRAICSRRIVARLHHGLSLAERGIGSALRELAQQLVVLGFRHSPSSVRPMEKGTRIFVDSRKGRQKRRDFSSPSRPLLPLREEFRVGPAFARFRVTSAIFVIQ